MPANAKDPAREHVERLYDKDPQYEWDRLHRHRTELAVTLRALREHLPPPPARVLDCGGGPGRFSIELTKLGYEVTLFDLSTGNLRMAREKAAEARASIARYERGTAIDLSHFADESFDTVLLMGPLYHLLEEKDRRRALAEARRVLCPGGLLFAAFITRYAPVRYTAAHDMATWPADKPDELESILERGLQPPQGEPGSTFVAYFCRPQEVAPLLRGAGFEIVSLLGVEGLVSMIEEHVNELTGEAWESWVEINYRAAADPAIHGGVEHLLAIAVKPRWRPVLRQIAQALDEAGIPFKVVGGTVAALHGVEVPVKDIDIEMDVENVYRFGELFAAHATQPVALSEGESYRSHFGRFDFDGLTVEVMGDLQRRQEEEWVPTMTRTETTVDLDGVPVHTSWLEEETLAYIRRDRLDRAAQCLLHCDRDRLLALLRGEQATAVL
jgi:ubiquinone/menaquinone biosynthesis C-methylase UbiE